jgi:hypothetical protein
MHVTGILASMTVATAALAADPGFVEPDVDVLYSMVSEQPGSVLGWVADPIGDINDDGRPDFITSAPWYVDNGNVVGKAYVFSGIDGSLLNSVVGNPGERLGWSATHAGDVNNDGTNDYIIGSRARALVMSGADHGVIHEWNAAGIAFGFDSNTAGDLNGDGYDDVLVGAPFAADNGPASGTVYAYSGVDGSVLWTFNGESGWVAGLGVGPVGDINGDGVPDVVVAAPGGNNNHKGIAFVLSGTDGGILLRLDPRTPSVSRNGASTFGVYHCHGAGDVNNDGVPDIYVGDYNAKAGQHNPAGTNSVGSGAGRAHIFSGVDGSILERIEGENFGDGMGPGRGVPDVDGDGHDDILVAAWAYGQGTDDTDVGKAYLVSGRRGNIIRTMTGTNPYEYVGVDAMAVGDVNGDTLTDYVLTGWGTLHLVLGN